MHGEDFASKRKMRDCLIGRLVVPAHQSKPKLGLELRGRKIIMEKRLLFFRDGERGEKDDAGFIFSSAHNLLIIDVGSLPE